MAKWILVVAAQFLCLTSLLAQDGDSAPLHDQLVAAKLPADYQAATQQLRAGDKVMGTLIVVSKPNEISKVIARIELSDRSAAPARRAATKAYINGFAADLANAGFKVTEKNIPDIDKESFEKPIGVDLTFANGEGKKLLTHQEIFFTDKGFVIQVIAEDSATLAKLMKWAKTIKPTKKP
jgi:hypothetical protein